MTLSKSTKKYLYDVWGCNKVDDIDPLTAHCILENCEESSAINPKTGKILWIADFELKKAYLSLKGLPLDLTAKAFRKMILFKNKYKGGQIAFLKGEKFSNHFYNASTGRYNAKCEKSCED